MVPRFDFWHVAATIAEYSESTSNRRLDRLAIWLSSICLIHCLVIPIAVFALPVVGDHLLGSESLFHWLLLAPAVPVSIISLWFGYRRHQFLPGLFIGTAGLTLMFIGVSHFFDRSYEIPLTIAGVSLVIIAHVLNMRRLRRLASTDSHLLRARY